MTLKRCSITQAEIEAIAYAINTIQEYYEITRDEDDILDDETRLQQKEEDEIFSVLHNLFLRITAKDVEES